MAREQSARQAVAPQWTPVVLAQVVLAQVATLGAQTETVVDLLSVAVTAVARSRHLLRRSFQMATILRQKTYAVADSAFTIVEGETCTLNPPLSQCASALNELEEHHWSLLNIAYNNDVLNSWRSDGCFEEIASRLGYRYALLSHESQASVARGNVLSVNVELLNDAYARASNARPVYLTLQGTTSSAQVLVDLDLRSLAPGVEKSFCFGAQIASDLVRRSKV